LGGFVINSGETEKETFISSIWDKFKGGWDQEEGHEDGGDDELHLQLELNGTVVDVTEWNGKHGGDNSDGSHNEWEVNGVRSLEE